MFATMKRHEKLELLSAMRAKARLRLLPFTLWTKPDYSAGWFHYVLAEKLDQFLADVVAAKSPRLIIMAPPRHGKSELVSRRFPAFAFGRFPHLQMIAASYSSDLASAMNRDVQKIIDTPEYHELFPDTTLSSSSVRTVTAKGAYLRNSENFEIVNHTGSYKSAGVCTGVTGRGGHILLIDDPVKDAQEAYSQTTRESVWNWYESTLKTRAEPGGGILLIMTRWHEDDLAGRLLRAMDRGGEKWDVIKFPALAEEDEEYRLKGEALHPARYPVEALVRIRDGAGTTETVGTGSRVWASLYQQRPAAAEGAIFKRENWGFFDGPPHGLVIAGDTVERLRTFLQLDRIIQYWDTAAGGKEDNDNSACFTLGISKTKYYLLDHFCRKIEFPDLVRQVVLEHDKWRPQTVSVEGGGSISGKSVIQTLQRETRIVFTEIIHSSDKVLRANLVAPIHEAGMCMLPKGVGWTRDFIEHCATFPNIVDDDDVDAFIGALETAQQGAQPMKINAGLLAKV